MTPSWGAALLEVARSERERLAVRTLTRGVTYGELVADVGALARSLGCTPRTGPVVMLASDGYELAVGSLAALSAGRAIVPADPQLAPEELVRLVDAVEPSTLLAGRAAMVDQATVGLELLRFTGNPPARMRPEPVDPDAPALVGFTSGSTGMPKLRVHSSRSLWRRFERAEPGLPHEGERFGMLLGATHAAVWRMVSMLLRGATVSCLDARSATADHLLAGFADHGVSYLKLIPTYVRRLSAAADEQALPSLRLLAAGGEALDWADVAEVRGRFARQVTVKHTYGSTETGRIAVRLIRADEPIGAGTVPVGRPVSGRHVWIRAEDGTPASPGEVGEIVVDADKLPDGEGVQQLPSGQVRYRTGDVGRFLADGQLAVLGRRDRRVKVGGIRVEPARVEQVLRQVAGVRDVALVVTTASGGEPELVAHLAGSGRANLEAEVRAHARRVLHPAAVPTRFFWHPGGLATLPSGKVDHSALASSSRPDGAG